MTNRLCGLQALLAALVCNSLAAQEEMAPELQPEYKAEITALMSNSDVVAAMEHIVARRVWLNVSQN